MVEIFVADEFEKRYQILPASIKRRAKKQEKFFRQNPFHPSLHIEKIEPKARQIWSLRIDKKYRILFRFIAKDKALFLTVGPHDWIYKIGF
ncbi:MAG: hypothetical protein LiPW39_39 [Parcubacteria group bacterium LiPW_39]|nr:MAG: hypothetical protein LiPW39_39 [Parcubacteria group bacterium LiPW_39]